MNFIFFFLLGLISIVSQVALLKEIMILYFGNELFLGIVLGIWLFSTSMGSFLGIRFLKIIRKKLHLLWVLLVTFLLLPIEVVLLRWLTVKFFPIYQVPSPLRGIALIVLILFPFCFLVGGLFTLGVRFFVGTEKKGLGFFVGRAYLWETLGLAVGGVIFNFFLIGTSFPLPSYLNNRLLSLKFPGLVEAKNTRYGNITVTQNRDQYSFFESGQFLGSTQMREQGEFLTHIALSYLKSPKKILVVGGGFGGVIWEVLKYKSIESIDYIELDSDLFGVLKKYLPSDLKGTLSDKRVYLNFIDGRKFLNQTKKKYDLIIFNLPNPSTALINRFYTREAFNRVKKNLNKDGVFVFSLFAPVDYLSVESASFLAVIKRTLESEFNSVKILPEEIEVLFVSGVEELMEEEGVLNNFINREIETQLFSSKYLKYRISSSKIKQLKTILESQAVQINEDFHPQAYFYENAFWQTIFSFKVAKALRKTGEVNFGWVIGLVVLICLSLINLKNRDKMVVVLVGVSGMTLMSFEVLILLVFQTILGILFSKIALIFAALLVSMAIGNWCVGRVKYDPHKILMVIQVLIVLYCLFWIFCLKHFSGEIIFYLLSVGLGFLGGTIFPLASKVYFEGKEGKEKTGVLYGADLLGAMVGAALTVVFLIPVFGVVRTVLLILLLNALCLFLLQKLGQCK